ncbi:MAG: right-handed parallel beta-helix repeat-containing protein, partial [Candidatus Sumerlaeota bacterium]|nr:right-handed parallel beta-helix repeat-containing protein [Candidatus Sumerlaeota bacterium]
MKLRSLQFLLGLTLSVSPLAVSRAATLYVSTEGRAEWSGNSDKPNAQQTDGPLPSLAAARDRIRALRARGEKGAVTALVRGGVYRLSEPFVLEPADSGTPDAPVTYAAYPGELPIFSGGRIIDGWKVLEGARRDPQGKSVVWTAPASFEFHQLFVSGQRAMRARIPHEGFYRIEGTSPGSEDRPARLNYRGNDVLSSWADLGDAEAVLLPHWKELRMQITKVDEANHVALLTGVATASGQERVARYFIENVPEGMWKPGNWYLDRKAGTVSYWAQRGQNVSQAEVIAPVLQQLVLLKGKPETGELVRNVIFRGLDFRHTDWTLGPNGYTSQQAAVTIPAAFEAVGAEEISVEHCRFTQMGGFGIEFGQGTKRNRIVANAIFDMGAGGIKVGLPIHVAPRPEAFAEFAKMLEDEARASSSNVVTDNVIYDLGLVFPGAVGIWVGQSDGNTVAHNHVHDLYYSGISVGWTWGPGPSRARNNRIEYNHIHNVGKNQMLSDMGGIYTLGTQPGTVVRNNLIHDVDRFSYGGWGIYTDGGSSQMVYENNIVYNCKSSSVNQNY